MSCHKPKSPQEEFEIERKQKALIALELFYGDGVSERILNARSSNEIDRILKQARLNQIERDLGKPWMDI